jgi:hypothetical protein
MGSSFVLPIFTTLKPPKIAPSLGFFHNFSHALMSDPISFRVDGEKSRQDLSGLLDIEREEIDFSQLTAEQIFNFVAPAPTLRFECDR